MNDMKSDKRSWLLWIPLALVLLVALYFVLRQRPVAVEVAVVGPRTLSVLIEEQGRTRARDPFIVAAPVTGRLLRISLQAGDTVEAGQTIARIALPPDDLRTEAVAQANLIAAEARKMAVEATLLELQSAHARAMSEEERRNELYKTGVTTAEELAYYRQLTEAAQARVLSARASLQAAEAEVESARSQLLGRAGDPDAGILNLTAPVSGTVYRIHEENERVLPAGTPLFSISRDNALELVVDLLTQDAVQVRPGQPLLITGWGGEEILQGEVLRVEPEAFTKVSALGVEEQRVNVVGTLQQVPEALGAGYRVDVAVVVWEQDAVLTVPASAVFQRNGSTQVYVVEEGRARLRALQTGRRNREHFQVLAGIQAGERVLLFPSDQISEGVRVAAVP